MRFNNYRANLCWTNSAEWHGWLHLYKQC